MDKQQIIENIKTMIKESASSSGKTDKNLVSIIRKGDKYQVRKRGGDRKTYGTFATLQEAEVVAASVEKAILQQEELSTENEIKKSLENLILSEIKNVFTMYEEALKDIKSKYGF